MNVMRFTAPAAQEASIAVFCGMSGQHRDPTNVLIGLKALEEQYVIIPRREKFEI